MSVTKEDLNIAVENVLQRLVGITELYPGQMELLTKLVEKQNVLYTSPTNSGKSVPPVLLPDVICELNKIGYDFPANPKVLFITALNSIQLSLVGSTKALGICCAAVTRDNAAVILGSPISVLFISPEVLKLRCVTQLLLKSREEFVLKTVDECHLGK